MEWDEREIAMGGICGYRERGDEREMEREKGV